MINWVLQLLFPETGKSDKVTISNGNNKLFETPNLPDSFTPPSLKVEFYKGTILDRIHSDLWIDIMKYYNIYHFAIGLCDKNYSGYRAMTIIEFNENKANIMDYYNNHQQMPLIDEECRNIWLSINGQFIDINDKYAYVGKPNIKNNTILILDPGHHGNVGKIHNMKIGDMGRGGLGIIATLFIPQLS
jgi:hypothetical protein